MPDLLTQADGIRIAYEAHGTGDTALVFVHGWSCDRSYWKEQLAPFSREFRVVAVDLAGHGDSERNRAEWTIAGFGGDVAAVVEDLDLERVVLIGHSMGGDVILETARRLPGRVAGMVWIDVYRELRGPRSLEEIDAFQAPFRADFVEATRAFVRGMFPPGTDRSLVEWIVEDMSSAPPEIALPELTAAISYRGEIPGLLEQLKLPLVAINPDAPRGDIPSMERHGIEVVLMPNVGHFPMLEAPERFNTMLREVIARFPR